MCITNYTVNANLFGQSYFASISYVDHLIGRVLGALDDLDLEKDTIAVLMSDRGFILAENGLRNKYSTLDLANNAPFMMRIPSVTYSDRLVELIDVFPSIVEAAGLPAVPQCPMRKPQSECAMKAQLLASHPEPNQTVENRSFLSDLSTWFSSHGLQPTYGEPQVHRMDKSGGRTAGQTELEAVARERIVRLPILPFGNDEMRPESTM